MATWVHSAAEVAGEVGSLVVVEANRAAATRIARILSAACDLAPAVAGPDPEQLKAELVSEPVLLACDLDQRSVIEGWLDLWPDLKVLGWTTGRTDDVLARARVDPRIRSIVGWPSYGSIPRPLELAVAARRLVRGGPLPPLASLVPWGAAVRTWRPASTDERDQVVTDVAALLTRAGAPTRSAERAAEVAHELLTNAMLVAPVDAWGTPKYAQDRRASVTLEPSEIPTFRLAFDGALAVLDATDGFGRLQEHQVLDGLLRGAANASAASGGPVLDTARGGAGLGLAMTYASSVALAVEVVPDASTRVLWFHDVDVAPRDYRSLPASLHLFRSPRAAGSP